jgi:tRNA(Ile)-lysidine synthase
MKFKRPAIQMIQKMKEFIKDESLNTAKLKIAIACSGGSDSMALAHCLLIGKHHFFPYEILIIHINHGWRGEESDADQAFVESYAKKHNIPCYTYKRPSIDKTLSPEMEASTQRKEVFKEWVDKGYTIFTAHTANDLFETMLWRLCDGKLETHDKGILVQTEDGQFRPFLTTTKEELQEFLISEGQSWREDKTNFDGKLMRSKLRMNVVPELLKVYPQALRKVSQEAVNKQKKSK